MSKQFTKNEDPNTRKGPTRRERLVLISLGIAISVATVWMGFSSIPPNHFGTGGQILIIATSAAIALGAIGYTIGGKLTSIAAGLIGFALGVWPIGFVFWLLFVHGASP